jgi:hypothetical protein
MKLPARAFLLLLLLAAPLTAQVTERPETVAPGKVLVRMDGLKLSYDREDAAGNLHSVVGLAATTVRTGLTSDVDLQLGLDLYLRETFTSRGRKDSDSGLGDVSFRLKWAIWRDEKSGQALAVLPYVRLPTGSSAVASKAIEGGIIVPWAMDAGAGVRAGAMLQWDAVRNDADNGYDARWLLTGFAERPLTGTISAYAEATAEARSTGLSDWAGTIGAGVLWRLSSRLQLDYEIQRGLNARASEWTHTWRANWEW